MLGNFWPPSHAPRPYFHYVFQAYCGTKVIVQVPFSFFAHNISYYVHQNVIKWHQSAIKWFLNDIYNFPILNHGDRSNVIIYWLTDVVTCHRVQRCLRLVMDWDSQIPKLRFWKCPEEITNWIFFYFLNTYSTLQSVLMFIG